MYWICLMEISFDFRFRFLLNGNIGKSFVYQWYKLRIHSRRVWCVLLWVCSKQWLCWCNDLCSWKYVTRTCIWFDFKVELVVVSKVDFLIPNIFYSLILFYQSMIMISLFLLRKKNLFVLSMNHSKRNWIRLQFVIITYSMFICLIYKSLFHEIIYYYQFYSYLF